MQHFILFFYILSFSSGIASIVVAVFIYTHYKKLSLKYSFPVLISLCIMMITLMLKKYIDIASIDLPLYLMNYRSILKLASCVLLTISFPFFIHAFHGLEISRARKYIFFGVDMLVIIAGIYYLVFFEKFIMNYIIKPVMQLTLLYGFVLGIIKKPTISDKRLKKPAMVFFIFSLIAWLLSNIEVYRDKIGILKNFDLFELFTIPLYYLIINVFAIVLSLRYFKRPLYWTAGSPSDYFVETYGITEREKIIITYLIEGLNNTEISRKLFISVKTVENHLSNIYSKAGCKNRVQLVNLILTNK